jgi:hypothetical protein
MNKMISLDYRLKISQKYFKIPTIIKTFYLILIIKIKILKQTKN